MPVTRSLSHRARAGLAAAVAVTALGAGPVLAAPAFAAPEPTPTARTADAATECSEARAALSQVRRQYQVARSNLVRARQQLRKAKATHKPAKIRKARATVDRIGKRSRTLGRSVTFRQHRMSYACAAPQSTPRANAAGSVLGLLGLGNGLDLGTINATQLTALLERALPGVSGDLSPTQLGALLKGFNAVGTGDVDPTDLLVILTGAFSPGDIAALLGGSADPAVLAGLAETLLGQLNGLAGGGFALPGTFDPTDLLATFAGVFGQLDPGQLGSLLGMISSATGADPSGFDLEQLTGLLDALVPGISDSFDAGRLTALLTAFKAEDLDPAALASLLGGQFSAAQLGSILGGTASDQLLGSVIAQVMAQLATAGGGGLELPSGIGPEALTALVGTVTDLLDALTGGGIVPVICGVLPIPGLCD